MTAAALADLGGLGEREGPKAAFVWAVPAIAPMLLPWLATLALLFLPSNRTGRAWLILVPLGLLVVTSGVMAGLFPRDEIGYIAQVIGAGAFGLAAVWLLAEPIRRRGRVLSLVLCAVASAVWGAVGFAITPLAAEMADVRRYVPLIILWVCLFWLAAGLALSGGLRLTGVLSRRRYGWFRTLAWMAVSLWVMWAALGFVFFGIMALIEGGVEFWESLLGLSILALVHLGVCLPFLILAFTSSFFRERLKGLMRLKEVAAVPVTPMPLPQPTISKA